MARQSYVSGGACGRVPTRRIRWSHTRTPAASGYPRRPPPNPPLSPAVPPHLQPEPPVKSPNLLASVLDRDPFSNCLCLQDEANPPPPAGLLRPLGSWLPLAFSASSLTPTPLHTPVQPLKETTGSFPPGAPRVPACATRPCLPQRGAPPAETSAHLQQLQRDQLCEGGRLPVALTQAPDPSLAEEPEREPPS